MCRKLGYTYDFPRLQDQLPEWQLRHEAVIPSTNDWAKAEVESGATQNPAVFSADSQSAGRGRGTNIWWSAPGNIAATFIFSQNPHVPLGLLPLLAGLGVRRALVRIAVCDDLQLKWPNDLVVGRHKLAGLLCERLRRVDLIGVGVNVNADREEAPAELQQCITSLRELTTGTWDLTEILVEIGRELQRVVSLESETAAHKMLDEYSLHHWATGKDIELIDAERGPRIRGRCHGIDHQGRLIVETQQEMRAIVTGSIVTVSG
jgi:biotin-[acetyl-CoA-carboxylase] ligase BirA-like protein